MRNGRLAALLTSCALIILCAILSWQVVSLQGGAQIMLAAVALLTLVAAAAVALDLPASTQMSNHETERLRDTTR